MKLYLEGLGNGLAVICLVAVAALLSRHTAYLEAVITLTFLILAVASGFVYKKRHGPLVWAPDGKGFGRLFQFLLGFGTLLGPLKLAVNGFPIQEVIPAVNLGLLIASVPLSGLSLAGPFFIGSWLVRGA